jgi:hypothetical protein
VPGATVGENEGSELNGATLEEGVGSEVPGAAVGENVRSTSVGTVVVGSAVGAEDVGSEVVGDMLGDGDGNAVGSEVAGSGDGDGVGTEVIGPMLGAGVGGLGGNEVGAGVGSEVAMTQVPPTPHSVSKFPAMVHTKLLFGLQAQWWPNTQYAPVSPPAWQSTRVSLPTLPQLLWVESVGVWVDGKVVAGCDVAVAESVGAEGTGVPVEGADAAHCTMPTDNRG